jgi:hypothetical protein
MDSSSKDTDKQSSASYQMLEKDLVSALALIPPPRTEEEYAASRIPMKNMLERRGELLFSISISPKAQRERAEAWSKLEQSAYASNELYQYAKNLLNSYSEAPQIEKLVMWELLRCRMDYWKTQPGGGVGFGGTGTSEILLKIEMARLLFSALELDAKALFEAIEVKRGFVDSASESEANRSEEEIKRLYTEQSKVAEKILERHWKLPP